MNRYYEVYRILSSVDELDDFRYNKLVEMYGLKLINGVIRKLVSEDVVNLDKFSKYILLDDERCCDTLTLYQYYVRDVSLLDKIDDMEKEKLLIELIDIINRLNILFENASCNDDILGKGTRAWICDKVEYCINHCNNIGLLDEIKNLYDLYVDKRNIFLNGYLKYVISIAYDYVRDDIASLSDFIQYGNIGLIRALETYDFKYNTKFTTYAGKWIHQNIRYNLKKDRYQIRKPGHIFELNSKRIKAYNVLLCELGREPSNGELAEYMGITLDEVKNLGMFFLEPKSIDEEIESFIDGGITTRLENAVDESVDVERDVLNKSLSDELNDCMLEFLTDREIFVLHSRYNNDMKYHEIGRILGVTYQRVIQIHNEAIKKLRKKIKVRKMESYIR